MTGLPSCSAATRGVACAPLIGEGDWVLPPALGRATYLLDSWRMESGTEAEAERRFQEGEGTAPEGGSAGRHTAPVGKRGGE